MIILSDEQKDIIKTVVREIKKGNKPYLTVSGAAGTGKSSIISVLASVLKRFAVCAYTGKAADVLRRKGNHSSTIHSIIYKPHVYPDGHVEFYLINDLDLMADGFIVDEASMCSREIHEDLLSFGKPIIYIGDCWQLEPISDNFNLMKNPMYRLETIHRNAGEIAHFAHHLKQGYPARSFKSEKKIQVVNSGAIKDIYLANVDQTICGYNRTRVELNNRVRRYVDIDMSYIAINEKIICLRNNTLLGLFNGMQGYVTEVHKNNLLSFVSDGVLYPQIPYIPEQFGKEKNDFFNDDNNPFDYGYVITNHKAQGSGFNRIIVYEQRSDIWDFKRWNYTAATRGIESVLWVNEETFLPYYLR